MPKPKFEGNPFSISCHVVPAVAAAVNAVVVLEKQSVFFIGVAGDLVDALAEFRDIYRA